MDGLTLLRRAHEAGLAVAAEGNRLVIRGPKRAEPVAQLLIEHKLKVLAALLPVRHSVGPVAHNRAADGNDATWWREHFEARLVHWFRADRAWDEAELLAYGELIFEWYKRYRVHSDPRRCAGCGDELSGEAGLNVDHGVRIHFDEVRRLSCITRYGQKWRGESVTGLQALGIDPPEGFELL